MLNIQSSIKMLLEYGVLGGEKGRRRYLAMFVVDNFLTTKARQNKQTQKKRATNASRQWER